MAFSALRAGERALVVASTKVGIREVGNNAGKWVAIFLASVGLGVGYRWCASFVYYCAIQAGIPASALPKKRLSASVRQWRIWALASKRYYSNPERIKRGDLFLFPHGVSHIGWVAEVLHDGAVTKIRTIEGNTNNAGSNDGDGVYGKWRTVDSEMRFIDMSDLPVAA